jgi:hypothetical protein
MPHFHEMLDPLVVAGRFSDALSLLGNWRTTRTDNPVLFDTFEAELLYETGREARAAIVAEHSLAARG